MTISSSRPYLVHAIHDWLLDNQLTPYVLVNAMYPNTQVPERFIENGQIVLNISGSAVQGFIMNHEVIEFTARFGGIPQQVHVPLQAVLAVYAYENGRGMTFSDDEDTTGGGPPPSTDTPTNTGSPQRSKPNLRIVK
jgi:stringent starvation protein B